MKIPGLRSPHEKLDDIVYFGRMLDKIRLHAEGKLPADYHKALGGGFDARCCAFLGVKYEDVVVRVRLGGEDTDMLEWCLTNGRKPSPRKSISGTLTSANAVGATTPVNDSRNAKKNSASPTATTSKPSSTSSTSTKAAKYERSGRERSRNCYLN